MKQRLHLNRLFLIALIALCYTLQTIAQTTTTVPVTKTNMRSTIEVVQGESTLVLTGLVPGNTYVVRTSRAAQGQLAEIRLFPTTNTARQTETAPESLSGGKGVRFKALSGEVELKISATPGNAAQTVPLNVSISCTTCAEDSDIARQKSLGERLANLQVTGNVPAQDLIRNMLVGGDCFSVSNITSGGNPLAMGTFSSGASNIGLATGMVMATGRVIVLPGPNLEENAYGGFGPSGIDEELSTLVNGELHDISYIEFDFTPTANTVQFEFVFGSEEYCEWVGTEYNDVFGFFISGPGINGTQNLAVVPGSGGVPVTINSINHLTNSSFYVNNSTDFLSCLFTPAEHFFECELDGWTKPLTATAVVIPCETYHIKLAIADVEDDENDSAVFLRANSFNAGGAATVEPAYHIGSNTAVEGCASQGIRFTRGNGDTSEPITINFSVSPGSTATAGSDYTPFSGPVIIPAGQTETVLPINVISDGIPEGQERIILMVDNACRCQQSMVEFLIQDKQAFTVRINQDTSICEGFSAPLSVETTGGESPFSYIWSTGSTQESILVSPVASTLYTVTVTDGCGDIAIDFAVVEIIPSVRETVDIELCAGAFIEIEGQDYSAPATVIDTSYELFFCGKITTYNLRLKPPVTGEETLTFCQGSSVTIGNQTYTQPGTVLDTLTASNGCDSVVTYTLVTLPPVTGSETIRLCPGESVNIGGTLYNQAGTVMQTFQTTGGCDSVVTYTIEILPQPMRSETLTFCQGESVVVGGVTITEAGTLLVFAPAATGCDTIITYTFVVLPLPTRTETIQFCPGETIQLGGNNYTQPGTVTLVHPASVGCDTVVTYQLQYLTPAPSTVKFNCPGVIGAGIPNGVTQAVVTFDDPQASSDCVCPGIEVTQTSGMPSGSSFPLGLSQVCFTARDACGQTTTCCFNIKVEEDDPCDVKVNGCLKYELLTITEDTRRNKTYRVRVTNTCASPLLYTAIQTPSGYIATSPANGSVYTAPSGNQYQVTNPNYSPFYSVRYRSTGAGIANGQNDVFKYTLPAQAEALFIHVTSKLANQQFYEAHLNTFYCPIGVTPQGPATGERFEPAVIQSGDLLIFPNPAEDRLNIDLSNWNGEKVDIRVLNAMGQRVMSHNVTAGAEPVSLELPASMSGGIYLLEVEAANRAREVLKFVVQR